MAQPYRSHPTKVLSQVSFCDASFLWDHCLYHLSSVHCLPRCLYSCSRTCRLCPVACPFCCPGLSCPCFAPLHHSCSCCVPVSPASSELRFHPVSQIQSGFQIFWRSGPAHGFPAHGFIWFFHSDFVADWSRRYTSGGSFSSRTCTPLFRRSTQRLECSGYSRPGPRSDSGLPAAHSGAPVPGSPVAQAFHPYAAPPPPLPVSPSRPSRFCTLPLPHSSPRRVSGSPALRRRRRSRSPVRSSSVHRQDQPMGPGPSRLFCPVASCPDHTRPSHGWLSFQTMRPHVEAHLSGQLVGDISSDWLRSHGFGTCEVCHRILSLRFNGRCPSCFHSLTASRSSPSSASRPLAEGATSIWDVFTSGTRVRSSVPAAARDAWSRCLIIALANVVAHRDVR